MRSVPSILLLGAALSVAALAPPARAQSTDMPWISLDGSPPGTPVSIDIDPASPGGDRAIIVIGIHGFYLENKQGPGGAAYVRPIVPGMGHVGQTGAPDLPAVQLDLALPPGIIGVRLTQLSAQQAETFPGVNVWPRAIPAIDDTVGVPEQFVIDPAIYGSERPWPPQSADDGAPASAKLGSIQGTQVRVFPFSWSPLGGTLQVTSRLVVEFGFEGVANVAPDPITRRRARVAQKKFVNWGTVGTYYPVNPSFYQGQYLFVLPQAWRGALQPLIDQKAARGFSTQVRYIPASGSTCEDIRAIIQNWYANTPAEHDHYCLLVGDEMVVPQCAAPIDGAPPTDDLFGSVDGDDLDEEVYVGRLAVSNASFAYVQADKILRYMDKPPYTDAFHNALLVAHKEGAPGKYVGAHESVRTGSYADPPDFIWIYGDQAAYTNTSITNIINGGVGVVAYRGHGSSNSWSGWNVPGDSYTTNDVSTLANGAMTPVVWSFACTNHDLPWTESIGEWWMYRAPGGGVSSYGASVPSATDQNHELDRQMFKAVYDLGLTTQAQAVEYAEARMGALVGSSNAWLYNLLGDPEMPIRRERPPRAWVVARPSSLTPCVLPGGTCDVSIQVLDAATGLPVSGLQVSMWKPAPLPPAGAADAPVAGDRVSGGGDEVFDNRYTDAAGQAVIPASPQTPGWVYFTVQDEIGNSFVDSIQVVPTADAPQATPALRFAAAPSVARGWTSFGFGRPVSADARITVFDVTGRAVRRLELRAGEASVRWSLDDEAGATVAPGLYLARSEGAVGRATTRVMVLR